MNAGTNGANRAGLLRGGSRGRRGLQPDQRNASATTAGCGWLFCDTSKNGPRRWCSMSACGTWRENSRRSAAARKG
ncbi:MULTISPECIES: CGNR zinc finger domain-containing protein [Amycolatopsis]|uniref:CGNR zinc finger domain-containing protein n=1 Tax=Amycolatopsis TaxID=1813 RepID=UPI000B855078|nr:CGNR zinc finger domain-containing protein [Amycolatopsis sacchari]